ncbi:LADA_0B01530g1_1 [Lachancea dasiensis]|uniref:rRNA-processing protein EFG1 n=1 Tax=Lachancea dasiensis TaxID=1072105 RepID=A0A1G4IS83_9SACH|nr:LADA_0B01530g1_1 [Lachancea dasiensis]
MDTKHRRKPSRPSGKSIQLAHVLGSGSNKIKKKIRDIERLLQRKKDVLPDTVLIEKERALDALRLELQNAEMRVKVQNNAKKYHMVRFFERKKALRRYNQAVKNANKKDIRERAIDLCYVVNFPKTEKYIALYPAEENEGFTESKTGIEKTDARRSTYRDLVASKMDSDDLPVSLSGILKGDKLSREHNGLQLKSPQSSSSDAGPSSRGPSHMQEEDEDEEEDDFFES